MTGQDITTISVLTVVLAVLWKLVGYLADSFIKKNDKEDDNSSKKLDLLLTMVHEQNVKMERMSSQLDHSYETVMKIEGREAELRGRVHDMGVVVAELKEWKRNNN